MLSLLRVLAKKLAALLVYGCVADNVFKTRISSNLHDLLHKQALTPELQKLSIEPKYHLSTSHDDWAGNGLPAV